MKTLIIQLFCLLVLLNPVLNVNVINERVSKSIDIASQLVKVQTSIVLNEVSSTYVFGVEEDYTDQLSFISASSKPGSEDDSSTFKIKSIQLPGKSGSFYEIDLKSGAAKSGSAEVHVSTVFTHKLVPFPSDITQAERQYVKFIGNAGFYSPYKTKTLETRVLLSSKDVLDYTASLKPSNKQESLVTYGPFKDVDAFDVKKVTIHYENNNPFLSVVDMTRVIEVSHWGNIAVEEHYHMVHSGARLKGSFSRYDYQRNQDGVSSVKSFKTILPASAKDVYYRDHIGNISTSHLKELSDSVEVELRPRFPLFGGWQTRYVVGYNVPSYEYLYHLGSNFALRMRFVDHVHDDMCIDRVTVKVILPEGVSDIRYDFPYHVLVGPQENLKTYLDTYGRTVLVMSKANLVEQHIQEFTVYYSFSLASLIREPVMVTIFFYILCMTVIVAVRLDFSIIKDEHSESKQRIRSLIEVIINLQDKLSAVYQSYEDATDKYKQHKELVKLNTDCARNETNHRNLTKQISEQIQKLKAETAPPGDAVEKLAELQQLDVKLHELSQQSIQQAERLVTGKLKREQYIESEGKIKEKKKEITGKIDTIIESL